MLCAWSRLVPNERRIRTVLIGCRLFDLVEQSGHRVTLQEKTLQYGTRQAFARLEFNR